MSCSSVNAVNVYVSVTMRRCLLFRFINQGQTLVTLVRATQGGRKQHVE